MIRAIVNPPGAPRHPSLRGSDPFKAAATPAGGVPPMGGVPAIAGGVMSFTRRHVSFPGVRHRRMGNY